MKRLALALLSASLTLFGGCSSGGAGGAGETGTVTLALTDSATDELTQFEVDVDAVTFHKAGGATVSVLPRATRVDFLQLESLSELVAVGSLPAGFYDRMTLSLDFSTASVLIVGQTTPAAVLDQDGDPITGVFDVEVDLTTGARPFVRAGRGHLFVLDLDLDQSVAVDAGGNSVTFAPVWTVANDTDAARPVLTSGTLQSIDLANDTFYVERRAVDDTVIDVFAVRSSSTTIYQLGGVVSLGDFGLGQLSGFLGQHVFVQGTFDRQAGAVDALAVETGAGVVGNGQDWVFGHVVARSGGPGADATLTVLGRSRDLGTGTRRYNTLHQVDVSFADTKVLRRGFGATYASDDVNVGQLVWIFGDLTGTAMDATGADGVVRMVQTSIFGTANGAVVGGELSLDVLRFDRRDVSLFDFDVSGTVQADPAALTIDVTGLATSGIDSGTNLRVLGFVSAVDASGADASAVALVDRTAGPKLLQCGWAPAADGVLGTSGSAVTIDVAAATIAFVRDGFAPTTLAASPTPTLVGLGSVGFYRIVQRGGVSLYTSFDAFRTAVASRAGTAAVRHVNALGRFDAGTQVFSALTAVVVLR
ncbi:MAG: DUF4382 domain-containing protein [Planctomycetes bacterium]|nr:DUF4382 domain-containing protein [Planctomycetota bacterium]